MSMTISGPPWAVSIPPAVSGAGIVQRCTPGTIAAPISNNVLNATQGKIATPIDFTQPAGFTLKVGSQIRFEFQGARIQNNQTDTFYVRFGKANGSADPIIASRPFNVAGTQNFWFAGAIDIVGANEIAFRWSSGLESVGANGWASRLLDATNIDIAQALYVSMGYTTPAASADSFALTAASVEWRA